MSDQNPLDFSDIYKPQQATPAASAASPSESTGNPLDFSDIYKQSSAHAPGVSTPLSTPTGLPTGGGSLFGDIYGQSASTPIERDESDRFTQEDPGANWLEKSWAMANKPLTETLFGWGQYRQGAGGAERFLEKTLSGLSSPLSLVTMAAFAPAAIGESLAGSALKEGLVEGADFLGGEAIDSLSAAAKVEKYAQAVDAAKKAQIAGNSIRSAVEANMPYQEFLNYGQYLKNIGLHETDMLGESAMRRGISQSLAKAGVGPKQAVNVAKGVETLVNAGFSIQAVQGAMYAYPRALDQLQNGDYDGATESILTAGANTLFGSLGLAHSLHSAKDLIPSINEKNNLPLSDEVEAAKKMFGMNEGQLASTQFGIEARRRKQAAQIFRFAGLPQYAEQLEKIPEDQKFRWDQEFSRAMRNIIVNEDHREALNAKQMEYFFWLDNGGRADVASQEIAALGHGFGLDEWIKAQGDIPTDAREARTIQDIAKEEANNILLAKGQMNDAFAKIREHENQLKTLWETVQDKDTPPEEAELARKQIDTVNELLNEQKLAVPALVEEYNRNAQWEKAAQRFEVYEGWINKLKQEIKDNPDDAQLGAENQRRIAKLMFRVGSQYENLFREKYEDLNKKLDEAAKNIEPTAPNDRNALEEFNKKVRIMGVNPQDIKLIEEAFPQFRAGQVNPTEDFREVLSKRQYPEEATTTDRKQMMRRLSQIDMELKPYESSVKDFVQKALNYKSQGHTPQEIRALLESDPQYDQVSEGYNRLKLEQRRLEQGLEKNIPSQYMGEVHKLPSGKKVAYLTSESMQEIQKLFGKDQKPSGQQIPASLTKYLIDNLRRNNLLLADLLDKAKNPEGDLVLSLTSDSHGSTLSNRLWTLREELAHHWQGSLARTSALAHLGEKQYEFLAKELPESLVDSLKKVGYDTTDSPVTVLEASAKMMSSKDLSNIGVTPEQASSFLHKYFTEIRKRHGDKAFDSLNHITSFARQVKNDFLTQARQLTEGFGGFEGDQLDAAVARPADKPLLNRIYPEPLTEAERVDRAKQIENLKSRIEKAEQELAKIPPEEKGQLIEAQAKLNKLWNRLDRNQYLQKKDLREGTYGEVHKFPDGKKLLWLSEAGDNKLRKAAGVGSSYAGAQYPRGLVDLALKKLRAYKHPDEELIRTIENARNEKGDLVLALTPDSSKSHTKLSRKLHTIREELNHSWQGSLANSNAANHLRSEQYESLRKELDSGILQHMRKARIYDMKDSPTLVLEAAAKMLSAKDLSTIGTTPENAANFLHKYFTEIRKTHGDNALDSLVHITKYGKELRDKFIASYRNPEPVPGPGESEATLPSVGEGGGGGTPEVPTGGGGTGGGGPEDPEWRRKFPLDGNGYTSGFGIPSWLNQPVHPALPDNIEELVDRAKGKVHSPEQIEYVQKVIKALARSARKDFSPEEIAFLKQLRKADDDNWDVGYNNKIIKSIVDNHIHHIWGTDPRKGYPVQQAAGSGAFSINASQARHRSWGTAFEGILQGRRLAVHDPSAIIAHDANNIAVASGNRKVIEQLINSKLKAPDGMPLAAALGRGIEVKGEDGAPAKEIVNPNIVRKIEMDESEIARLEKAGLLDRYIKDGIVVDRTPKVDQNNIAGWIKATKDKMAALEKKNPLLTDPTKRKQHEAGWGQVELFAKDQAGKIASYLHDAIDQAQQTGTAVPRGNKDAYGKFSMGAYYDKLLHEKAKILPQDLQRLEEYRQRNENFSNGLNGKGTGPMTPADVARFIMQEKDHLDPELTKYVDEFHDWFAPRDEKGNRLAPDKWNQSAMTTTMYHIAHAALNKEYPQLIQDMDDLNYVDKNLTSANPITQQMHKEEALKRLEDINARQPRKFLWDPKGYIVVDHPAFHDYKWMATAPDGTPILASSAIALHPSMYDYVVNRLGLERSALREEKGIGRFTAPLLKAGATAKYAILSGSPFHVIQEALRGFMLGINPLVRPNPVENISERVQTVRGNLPLIRLGIENSLNIFNNRFMAEDASVGVASHLHGGEGIRKIPVLGHYVKYADSIHDFLFNRYIPSLKVSAFKRMFDKYAESHPDWSNDSVAYAAAQHVNNAFGGINWREFGRSATTQDWFHILALAPDWLESEMRFAAGLFRNWGIGVGKYEPDSGRNYTRSQVAIMATTLWAIARVLNLAYSGNAHYETPFGLATKDKDGREIQFSVRTMPTDILHLASDPMEFIKGRMSPIMRTGQELWTGRNAYGQKLTPGEKYVDMVSNLVPIWGQSVLKEATHLTTAADVPGYAQVAKALGATSNTYRTPAEKTAANLASERSEEGQMNPAKVARHRLLMQLEDDVRAGRIKVPDLEQMVAQGNLPIADAKAVMKNVKDTAGQDSETARLYSRVSRLDFAGAMAVWDDANPSEKKVLEKLIRKKAAAYLKKSITDFTPDERMKDPMFKRARQIAPLLETTSPSQ